MENEIHKNVFIQMQTKYFPYSYVNEKIYSKCTLEMAMQATISFRLLCSSCTNFPKYKFSQSFGGCGGMIKKGLSSLQEYQYGLDEDEGGQLYILLTVICDCRGRGVAVGVIVILLVTLLVVLFSAPLVKP